MMAADGVQVITAIILITINLNQVNAFFERVVTINDESTLSKWEQSYKFLQSINWSKREGIELILNRIKINNSSSSVKLSSKCEQFLQENYYPWNNLPVEKIYLDGKFSLKFNQYLDAWFTTGPSSSPLSGHTTDPGSPLDCLEINGLDSLVQVSLPTPGSVEYQRALVNNLTTSLRFNITSSEMLSRSSQFKYYAERIKYFLVGHLYFGICTPIQCSLSDINIFLDTVSAISGSEVTLYKYHQTVDAGLDAADIGNDANNQIATILAYLVFAYFIFVVIASSIYSMMEDGIIADEYKIGKRILKNFSFVENKKILCAVYEKDHYQKMRPLDTVKFYFQIIASALHIVIITPCLPITLPSLKEWRELVHYSAFGNDIWLQFSWGIQLVFAISGFFSCYVVYPILQRTRGKLPLQFFILKRWLRTVPTLIAMMILYMIVPVIITSNNQGFRAAMDFLSGPCYDNPWQTIFFFNNWSTPLNKICVFQSWFISSDFQLWILAYIPLILLYRAPKIGVSLCLLIMILASVSTTFSLYYFDLPTFPVGHETDILVGATHSTVMPMWYFAPHNNAFCYFSGILTAFYCLTREKLLKQSNVKWIISWTSFLIIGMIVNFFPAFYKHVFFFEYSRTIELCYGLVARASVASYAVILFICLYNKFHQQQPLKYFMDKLNWDNHTYTILGRLSFSVFLSHILVFFVVLHFFTDAGFFPISFWPLLILFLVYNFFCYIFGYFLYLFVEAPMASILSQFTEKFYIQEYGNPKDIDNGKIRNGDGILRNGNRTLRENGERKDSDIPIIDMGENNNQANQINCKTL